MGIECLQYDVSTYSRDIADAELLEETSLGALSPELWQRVQALDPSGVTDRDDDGLREINIKTLEQSFYVRANAQQQVCFKADKNCVQLSPRLPVSTYFNDLNPLGCGDRLQSLPQEMKSFTLQYDFVEARKYFTAEFSENPKLAELAERLALHLSATAVHAGVSFTAWAELRDASDFSRTREGYLRFNCSTFTQLAQSNLQGIPGLQFTYVLFSYEENTQVADNRVEAIGQNFVLADYQKTAPFVDQRIKEQQTNPTSELGTHIVLIIEGNDVNLLIDNDHVTVLAKELDLIAYAKERWQSSGFNKISMEKHFTHFFRYSVIAAPF